MDKIKKQALEAAGWKFGDAEDFLNEGRPMSDDKIRAEFEAYAEQRNWSIRKNHGSYYWAEAARAWHIWQAAYAAGQKAEREAIQKESLQQLVDEAQKLDMGY